MAAIGTDPEEISRWLLRGSTPANAAAQTAAPLAATLKQPLPTTEEEFGQRLDQYYQQVEKPAKDAIMVQQQEAAANAPPTGPGFMQRAMEQLGQSELAQTTAAQAQAPVLHGIGEAALSTATGLAGGVSGLATFGAGAVMAPVLGLAKTPEERATYWTDLVKTAREVASNQTYEPRTEVGKAIMQGPNAVMDIVGKISEAASEGPIARLLLTPDQRQALRYAHEIVTTALLTEGAIKGLGGVRSKIASVKSEFAKFATDPTAPTSAPKLISSAEALSSAVQNSPAATEALTQARKKLTDVLGTVANKGPEDLASVLRQKQETEITAATDRVQRAKEAITDVPWNPNDPMQPSPPASVTAQQRAQMLPLPGGEGIKSPVSTIESSTESVVDTTPAIVKPTRTRIARKKIVADEPATESAQFPTTAVSDELALRNTLYTTQDRWQQTLLDREHAINYLPSGPERTAALTTNVDSARQALQEANTAYSNRFGRPPVRGQEPEVTTGRSMAMHEMLWENSTAEARRQWLGEGADISRPWNRLTMQEQRSLQDTFTTPADELARRPVPAAIVEPAVTRNVTPTTTKPLPEKTVAEAIRTFGTTTNPQHGGYLLPDGQLLNFADAKGKMREHQEIYKAFPDSFPYEDTYGYFDSAEPEPSIGAFIHETGATRWRIEGKSLLLEQGRTGITPGQQRTIMQTIRQEQLDRVHVDRTTIDVAKQDTPNVESATFTLPKQRQELQGFLLKDLLPQVVTESAATAPKYAPIRTFADLNNVATTTTLVGEAVPIKTSLQVRSINGKPDALLIDTAGLNTPESLTTIRSQVERGQMAPDVAQAMEASLRRQADLGGVPIEQGHNFTAERLLGDAMRLAYDNGLELYRARKTKTGIEYEQVPREAIKTAIDLQHMNPMEPVALSKENAAAYVAEKTRPVGGATLDEIKRALETGTDISAQLPEDIQPHFRDMLEQQRKGLNTNEIRTFVDILKDIIDVVSPFDQPDPKQLHSLTLYGLTDARKAAALRLWADAQKAQKWYQTKTGSFKDILDETTMPDAEKILFMRYIDGVNKPALPQGINPRDMRFDSSNTDPVISQRTESVKGKIIRHTPLYESEINALQQAKELRDVTGLTTLFGRNFGDHSLLVHHYAMRRMGLLDFDYAYRASERAFSRERAVVYRDLDAMAVVHDKASRERIGEYGYSNTEQGINILIRNERDIPTLNRDEQITMAAQQKLFDETLFRVNEAREATGKELIEPIENYIPFLRTFSLAEKMNMGLNLMTDSAEHINAMQERLGEMQYPRERKRIGAAYTAEFDSFKLLKDYMDGALRQINLAPFVEKLRELTQYPLPEAVGSSPIDPRTGRPTGTPGAPTWLLSEHKPGAFDYLTKWGNFLEHGTQPTFASGIERAANTMMSNLAGGLISLSLRSGLVHVSRLRGTFHRTGYLNTFQAVADTMADSMRYFFSEDGTKWKRNLDESQVLDSRGLIDSYDDVSAAIMGGRPRDFLQALKDGEARTALRQFDTRVGFAWMRAVDNTIAQVAYNAARNLGERGGLSGNKLRNFADDHVVLTEGGTMPGDVAAIQYTTGGKMVTQFHRWTINNWNYFIEDVLGATGRKDVARLMNRDPDKYVPAVIKSAASFIIATTAMNVFFEDVLHTRTPLQAPLREVKHGVDANDSMLGLAGRLAGSVASELPIIGPTAHGFGVGGAVLGTLTDVGKQIFNVPGAYKSYKEGDSLPLAAARLYGSPTVSLLGGRGSRQVGQIVKGIDRNEPLTSFYQPPLGDKQKGGSGLRTLQQPSKRFRQVR